jgi:hypothetical protein
MDDSNALEMKIIDKVNYGIKDRMFYTVECSQGHKFEIEDRYNGASYVICPFCNERKLSLGGMIFRYKKTHRIR